VDAIRAANGDTIFAVNDSAIGVMAVDPSGNVVAQVPGFIASSVQELGHGDWLISDSLVLNGRVAEVVPSTGQVIWSYGPPGFCDSCLGMPRDGKRTSSGNTLIVGYGKDRVLEVNSSGQIVWAYDRVGSGPRRVREVLPLSSRVYLPIVFR